jgi:hypothetical protein
MKTVTAPLQTLLNASGGVNPIVAWDLFTILLTGGGLLTYTTAPFPIYAADNTIWNAPDYPGTGTLWASNLTWLPKVLDDGGGQALGHWKVGLDSDSFQFKIAPSAKDLYTGAAFPDQIGSVAWLAAARAGALDGAFVYWDRAYFASVPTHPIPVKGLSPVGTLCMQRGIVGQIDFSNTAAFVTVNDFKSLLSQQMPRNVYQASCRHRLFDSRCTLTAATYTKTGAASAGSTQANIVATVAAPGGSATFALGTLTMTSGLNSGVSRMVSSWAGGNFSLLSPMPFTVAPGDTFSVTAGCNKSQSQCTAFGNLVNFGGESYVPPPEMSIG